MQSLPLPELAAARASGYRGRRSGYRKAATVTAGLALTTVLVAAVLVPGLWWPAPIETYRTGGETVKAVPTRMAGILAMMTSRFMVETAVAASPCSGPRRSSHAS